MELWNSHELCKAVNGKSQDNSSWQANSISIDTRSIKDGGVFFALKGYIRKIACDVIVFPHPDSPTIPTASFFLMSNVTPSKA